MDIVLTPDLASLQLDASSSFPAFWVNETAIRSSLAGSPTIVGTAPRWTLVANGVHPTSLKRAPLVVLICDSLREQEIGAGRTWQRRPLVTRIRVSFLVFVFNFLFILLLFSFSPLLFSSRLGMRRTYPVLSFVT